MGMIDIDEQAGLLITANRRVRLSSREAERKSTKLVAGTFSFLNHRWELKLRWADRVFGFHQIVGRAILFSAFYVRGGRP